MSRRDDQANIEYAYSKNLVQESIKLKLKDNEDILYVINEGIKLVTKYINNEGYYDSKQARVNQLKELNIKELVTDLILDSLFIKGEELLTSFIARSVSLIKFGEKYAAVKTIGELVAVLSQTNAFDIIKPPGKYSSLLIKSNYSFNDEYKKALENVSYLPPMVCKPKRLMSNRSSAYLLDHCSLILGKGNYHGKNICLDVLNIKNVIPMSINTDFVNTVPEEPKEVPNTMEEMNEWNKFKTKSQEIYQLMVNHQNRFYLTHKVDKRGRIYAQGYHINTQGSSYKKAMLDLADKELVNGDFL